MKRPWEILSAGIVLGELIILKGGPLRAAGAGLAALLLMLLLRCMGPAVLRFPVCRPAVLRFTRIRLAAALFSAAAAAGMLRMAAEQVPGEQERRLDEWMCAAEEETGIEFVIEDLEEDGERLKLRNGCLLVYCGAENINGIPDIGSRAAAFGKLSRFPEARNPGEFDAASYYKAKGVTHRLYADRVSVTGGKERGLLRLFSPARLLFSLRRSAEQELDQVFSAEDAGVLKAALLGDRNGMPEDLYERYRRNGIAHLLAISGLHTAVLGLGLYRLIRRAGGGFRLSGVLAGAFLLFYSALTGGSTAVVRAVLMMLLLFLSSAAGRTYDLRSAAAASMAAVLLANPLELVQCGFQLSFLAVFAIGGPAKALTDQIRKQHPAQAKHHPRLFSLLSAVAASFSVFFSSLPVTAWWFFAVPVWGPLLNLAVIPLMQYVLWAGLAALLLSGIGAAGAAGAAAAAVRCILRFYTLLCGAAETLPFHRVLIGRPSFLQIALYYLLLLLVWIFFRKALTSGPGRLRVCAALLSGFLLTSGCLLLRPFRGREAVLWFLDVGQGDAIVVEYRDSCVLIDGGSSSSLQNGKYTLRPFLESRGRSFVETAFITHADQDHTNGVMYLLEEDPDLQVGQVVLNAAAEGDERYDRIRKAAGQRPVRYMAAGDRRGCFACLWPDREHPPGDTNEQSLVMLFECCGHRCLFTGDAGQESEEKLLEMLRKEQLSGREDCIPGPVDVLKAGHHGSAGSTGEELLTAFPPETAVLSYGEGNRYGHPHRETLKRLRACGAVIRSTAEEGAVKIVFR
ncbi:MAG: DNA internalization-related competence protein ComEC/Rec2 [Stomatobaculum sp.]|nr:DNA internalization-related competence protein ComEC/Rec2 [Stomatobaculum sp.]